MVPVISIIVIIASLAAIIFAVRRAIKLGKNAKTGNAIDMTIIDGVPNILPGMVVLITLEDDGIFIKERIGSNTARVRYDQITDFGLFTDPSFVGRIKEVEDSHAGLLLSVLYSALDGEVHIPEITECTDYFIIIYVSADGTEHNALTFGVVGSTWGLANFYTRLCEKTGITHEIQEIEQNITL